jgi:predicted nuclease of predicted toxin-antitoxin system
MKFLIDNALSPILVKGLKEHGFDALHVRDIGMATASDDKNFEYALKQDRILISADTDFGTLLAFRESSKPSFILLRQTEKRPSSQLKLLLSHIADLENDLNSGAVIVLEDNRIRIRKFPISREE